MRFAYSTIIGLGVLTLLGGPARAVPANAFQAQTTSQLLELCTAPKSDPDYAQARQFCYGFTTGALSYRRAVTRPGSRPEYCKLPASRAAAVGDFVSWARAHPQYANENPANTLFRFLDANFRCNQ